MPIFIAFSKNKSNKLNLSEKQFKTLIKNSDLTNSFNNHNRTPAMYAICNYSREELKIPEKEFLYLLNNSDINHESHSEYTLFDLSVITSNTRPTPHITDKCWKFILFNTNFQNQTNFQKGLSTKLDQFISLIFNNKIILTEESKLEIFKKIPINLIVSPYLKDKIQKTLNIADNYSTIDSLLLNPPPFYKFKGLNLIFFIKPLILYYYS
jgi:hypothetical protein